MGVQNRMKTSKGFSLLELMAAITVLGIGLVSVLYALRGSVEVVRQLERRETAQDLLVLKLNELSGQSKPLEKQKGAFEAPYENFTWSAEAVPTDIPGLFHLKVEVLWIGRNRQRQIQVETLVPQR